MKLSFIIVSYNEIEYLEQAINSCLNQGLDDFEVVIGDDGSNDGSVELIKQYAEQYPEIIRYSVSDRTGIGSTKDIIASLRVSDVITRSLKMAKGDYCVILSGDDYFYKGNFFENAISFLDSNPDYVTYVGGYEKVWEDRPACRFYSDYSPRLYWAGKYIHLSSFIFRKEVFEQGAFLQRFCDDAGLVYSLAISGKWKYNRQTVFAYRQRNSSIMHSVDEMEFRLVELMLLQDVLCKGILYTQSMAHFSKSLNYVFSHRSLICEEKYKKYIDNCQKYECNIIRHLSEYDEKSMIGKMKIRMQLFYASTAAFIYRVIFKMKEKMK